MKSIFARFCAIKVMLLCCAVFMAGAAQAKGPQQAADSGGTKPASVLVSLDIVQFPSAGVTDTTPFGLSFGGTFYVNDNIAFTGALGFGIVEDEGLSGDPDIGLDTYFRANAKFGNFSTSRFTLYGLVGLEPYTLTVDGTAANESVGEMAFGFGGSMGNARMHRSNGDVGFELVFVQDSDIDDDIVRWSVYWNF